MVIPCMDNALRGTTLDRPVSRVSRFENLPYDIELSLLHIIEKEVDLIRRLDTLKADLEYRHDYTPLAAFKAIDKHNEDRIHPYTVGNFLRNLGHCASELEIMSIIRRIDTDGDAKLSYNEFAEFLMAFKPSPGSPYPRRYESPARARS